MNKTVLKKRFSKNKDKFKRMSCKNKRPQKTFLKTIFFEEELDRKIRKNSYLLLTKHPRNSSITRLRNRCVVSSRGKGVKRSFHVSRIAFKEFFSRGWVSGFYK